MLPLLTDNDSSDELSDSDFHPVVSNFSFPRQPLSSPSVTTATSVPERKKAGAGSGKVPKLTISTKRGARSVVEGGNGLKRIGAKRGASGPTKSLAKKERLKVVKSTNKVKGLEVKTISMTNQKPIPKNFDDDEDDDQLVISLPRPAASTVTASPGPIPNLPPSQFLDTSSSSSSSNDSSSSGSGDSSGSEDETDSENTPKNNGSTDRSAIPPLVKCTGVVHPLGDHAYGAPPSHNSRLSTDRNSIIAKDGKIPEAKNDVMKGKQNSITAKPTPQRPSVLVVSECDGVRMVSVLCDTPSIYLQVVVCLLV